MTKKEILEFYENTEDKTEAFEILLKESGYKENELCPILGIPTIEHKVSPNNKAIVEFHKILDEFENTHHNIPEGKELDEFIIKRINEGYTYREIGAKLRMTPAQINYRVNNKMRTDLKALISRPRINTNWCGELHPLRDIKILQANAEAYEKIIEDSKKQIAEIETVITSIAILRDDMLRQIDNIRNIRVEEEAGGR